MKYPNTIALVTGASSGLGEALCRDLIKRGWTAIAVARSGDKLQTLKNELGENFYPIACDVSDRARVESLSKELQASGLIPSIFFLNAAVTGESALETVRTCNLATHDEAFAVNYFGVLAWVEVWQEVCMEQGGANFVLTSSLNAIFPPPIATAYSASKAAISKAFEGLALSYYGTNLKFSVVFCGPIETKGLKAPRKLPFTWSRERMARYMIERALKHKATSEPQLFYSILCRLLHLLPPRWALLALK